MSYAKTAYNSSKITRQQKAEPNGFIDKLLRKGSKQSFSKANKVISTRVAREDEPDYLNDERLTDRAGGWNEQRYLQHTGNAMFQFYYIISCIGKGICLFLMPLSYFVFIVSGLIVDEQSWTETVYILIGITLYVLLPSAFLWIQFELYNHGYWKPWFTKPHKDFELNRQTGMITLYKSNDKPRYSHPFIEFDCVIASVPSHQGLMTYQLLLAHRYSNASHAIPLQTMFPADIADVGEHQRLWNMVQRYIDTSQPMPDIPTLELFRHKDPVTAADDQKTKRNPRYWRDMTKDEFHKVLNKLHKKQLKQPTTGKPIDIFK